MSGVIVRFATHSVNGVKKKTNQDGLCFMAAETTFGPVAFGVVCDGVGGLENGELASSVVVRRFERWFETGLPSYLATKCDGGVFDLSGLSQVWGDMLAEANEGIFEYGNANNLSLGTTFTGLLSVPGAYFVAQVGDSRAYRYSQETLFRLTRDQSWAADEVEAGNLTEEEALHHPNSNVIYQAIGAQPRLEPAFYSGASDSGDLFLVCCDGFYRDISFGRLQDACAQMQQMPQAAMQDFCERLVQESIENGSNDNVSLLCFVAEEPDGGTSNPDGVSWQAVSPPGRGAPDDTPTVFAMDARTVITPSAGPSAQAGGGGSQ